MTENECDRDVNEGRIAREEFVIITHEHINEYIKLADNKASILLSGLVAYLGITLSVIGSNWGNVGTNFRVVAIVIVVTALLAVYNAARAVYPDSPETPQGLILWDSIVKKSREEYQEAIQNKSGGDLLDELIDENYKLAEVSAKKYARVRSTLFWTGVTVILAIVFIANLASILM